MGLDTNVIVQIFLVLGTISVAVISWIKLTQSNNLIKEELDVKIRPILGRTTIGDSNLKTATGVIHEPVFSLQPTKVLFHFTNTGMLPAKNITKRSYVRLKRKNGWILTKTSDDISVEGIKLASLAPNEKYSIDVFYDTQHYKESLALDTCYFGLILNYEDPKGEKFFYHMEGHFEKQYLMLDKVDMN